VYRICHDLIFCQRTATITSAFIVPRWVYFSVAAFLFLKIQQLPILVSVIVSALWPGVLIVALWIRYHWIVLRRYYYPDMVDEEAFCAKWSGTDRDCCMYVASLEGGMAIASCGIRRRDEKTCQLGRVATAKEYQGRGVASFLLKEVMKECASLGYTRITLQTGMFRVEAIRLYQAEGFKRFHSEVGPFGLYTMYDYEYDLTQGGALVK
jgi:GNAT superfamily N-acetyltransferase